MGFIMCYLYLESELRCRDLCILSPMDSARFRLQYVFKIGGTTRCCRRAPRTSGILELLEMFAN